MTKMPDAKEGVLYPIEIEAHHAVSNANSPARVRPIIPALNSLDSPATLPAGRRFCGNDRLDLTPRSFALRSGAFARADNIKDGQYNRNNEKINCLRMWIHIYTDTVHGEFVEP